MTQAVRPMETEETLGDELTPWQRVWQNLVSNRLAMAGGAVLVLFVLIAIVGWRGTSGPEPYFNSSQVRLPDRLKPPFSRPNPDRELVPAEALPRLGRYLFGTDELGRDVFARMLEGATVSMAVGFVAVGIAVVLGVVMGGTAGFYGERQPGAAPVLGALAALATGIAIWRSFGWLPTGFLLQSLWALLAMVGFPVLGGILGGRAEKEKGASVLLAAFIGGVIAHIALLFFSPTAVARWTITLGAAAALGAAAYASDFRGALRRSHLPRVDTMFIALVDVQLSFPTFFLILTVIALLPPSIWNIMIVIGVTGWVGPARFVRAEILSLRERPFIEAAVALGMNDFRLIFRHLVPNSLAPVLVSATIGIATAILVEAALSFLGFGVPPPQATWGNILSGGKKYIFDAPWLTFIPGTAILIVVLAFNLFGEGLRDALNPRLRA